MFKKLIQKHIVTKILILIIFIMPLISLASVPSHLSYTGRLTDTGGNPLGAGGTIYYFKFSIWDSPTPGEGSKLWPTSAPTATSLTVKQGSFSVLIGDTANGYPDTLDYDFSTSDTIYLQVEVSSDNNTFETLAPRSLLSSNAFSQIASRVSGIEDSSFGTTTSFADTLVSMLSTAIDKAVLTIKGAVGQVANLFNVKDSDDNTLFTITADGKVGVGTSTPTRLLSVASQSSSAYAEIVSGASHAGIFLKSAARNWHMFSEGSTGLFSIKDETSGENRLSITSAGNVGIGATSTASSKLHIDGGNATASQLRFTAGGTTGQTSTDGTEFGITTTGVAEVRQRENLALELYTANTLRMQITGAGNMIVDGSASLRGGSGSAAAPFFTFNGAGIDAGMYRGIGSTLGFSTTGTSRMFILSTGEIGIGTSTASVKLSVVGNAQFTAVTSGTYAFDLNLTSDGILTTASSDERLKENITLLSASSTIEKLLQLKPSQFDWKSNSTQDIGLIAQEVEEIFPELVFTNPTDGYKGINYSRLPVLLLSAVQEIISTIRGFAEEFRTQKLCVGDTCITEGQLIELLEGQNVQSGASTEQSGDTANTAQEDTGTGDGVETEGDSLEEGVGIDEGEVLDEGSGDTAPSSSGDVQAPEPEVPDTTSPDAPSEPSSTSEPSPDESSSSSVDSSSSDQSGSESSASEGDSSAPSAE